MDLELSYIQITAPASPEVSAILRNNIVDPSERFILSLGGICEEAWLVKLIQ